MAAQSTPDVTPVGVKVVEWNDLDHQKFFPMSIGAGLCVRGVVYPFALVKTRIMVQKKQTSARSTAYTGTYDALRTISRIEGVGGLYRGFWLHSLTMFPSFLFVLTYENVRHRLKSVIPDVDSSIRGCIAGFTASCVSQSFMVPLDTVSQFLMVARTKRDGGKTTKAASSTGSGGAVTVPNDVLRSRHATTQYIIQKLYRQNGFAAFYKGYLVNLMTFAPGSALFWLFYDKYCQLVGPLLIPNGAPQLVVQALCAPFASVTSTIITNPIDVVRVRVMVDRTSLLPTIKQFVKEERLRVFTKGLTARASQNFISAFLIITSYEMVKQLCKKPIS